MTVENPSERGVVLKNIHPCRILSFSGNPLKRFAYWVLTFLVWFLILSLTVVGQGPVISVREALQDNNGDRIPDRLGETVTLVGVITSTPIDVGEQGATLANIQDETGGIVLFARDSSLVNGHFSRGDVVQVHGKVGQYRGMEELLVEGIRRLRTGAVMQPRDVLAADLQSERYSGQLVRLKGWLDIPQNWLDRKTVVVRDQSGEIPVFIAARFFTRLDFVDRLLKDGEVELTGIASQYKEKPPYDSGYRLVPRSPDDFAFGLLPYRTIVLSAALLRTLVLLVAVLVLLGLTVYLWMRHRSAEKRVREVTALSESAQRSEEAMRQSEAKFRDLFDHAPVGYHEIDTEGRITRVNRSELSMLGYTAEEVLGRHVWEFVQELEVSRQAVTDKLSGTQPLETFERTLIRKDGTLVPVLIEESYLRNAEGRIIGIRTTVQDIAARKRAEEELRQAQVREQRQEAARSMLQVLMHEIYNPLTGILGNISLLRLEDTSPAALECLAEMEECSRRIDSALKELAKLDLATPAPVTGVSKVDPKPASGI